MGLDIIGALGRGLRMNLKESNANCTHLLRVDGIHNGCLLCGFVNEQVHVVVGEGGEQLDGRVTELLCRATGVVLGHARQGTVDRYEQSSRGVRPQNTCCKQGTIF